MATTREQLKAAIEALDLGLVERLVASGVEINTPLQVRTMNDHSPPTHHLLVANFPNWLSGKSWIN
jgi:uncharacterized membrane protein YagU involved in acid resistance